MQVPQEFLEVIDMPGEGVGIALRFIREAAAHMIQGDNPVRFREKADGPPVIIGPGGIAVHHDNDRPLSFIDIMQAMPRDAEEMGFEWVLWIQNDCLGKGFWIDRPATTTVILPTINDTRDAQAVNHFTLNAPKAGR